MACKRRKKEKRAQDLMRIRERKNHLNTAVNEDNSDNSILEDPINAAEEEDAQEVSSLPEFCLLYTSPSPRDMRRSRMPSSA